jgi:hypothetical protein
MQVWKRRLTAVLAVAAGSVGLMMSGGGAGATPGDIPNFPTMPPFPTMPTFPEPPTMPPFTVPTVLPPTIAPPTMPPFPTMPTFPEPPTMPPITSPPSTISRPTIVPPTIPPVTTPPSASGRVDSEIQSVIDDLADFGDRFQEVIDDLRAMQGSF